MSLFTSLLENIKGVAPDEEGTGTSNTRRGDRDTAITSRQTAYNRVNSAFILADKEDTLKSMIGGNASLGQHRKETLINSTEKEFALLGKLREQWYDKLEVTEKIESLVRTNIQSKATDNFLRPYDARNLKYYFAVTALAYGAWTAHSVWTTSGENHIQPQIQQRDNGSFIVGTRPDIDHPDGKPLFRITPTNATGSAVFDAQYIDNTISMLNGGGNNEFGESQPTVEKWQKSNAFKTLGMQPIFIIAKSKHNQILSDYAVCEGIAEGKCDKVSQHNTEALKRELTQGNTLFKGYTVEILNGTVSENLSSLGHTPNSVRLAGHKVVLPQHRGDNFMTSAARFLSNTPA